MTKSKISWTTRVWNPTTGCSHASAGCDHCYAEAISHRFRKTTLPWTMPNAAANVRIHPERLAMPFAWKAPSLVFVDSMSDLFHPNVPDEFVVDVFAVMVCAPLHTFQILTKRPGRMQTLMNDEAFRSRVQWATDERRRLFRIALRVPVLPSVPIHWPMPNVWLGTSVEDGHRVATDRIGELIRCPAAVRFLSCEPLIGPLELAPWLSCDHPASTGYWPSGLPSPSHPVRYWKCDKCGEIGYDEPESPGSSIHRHVSIKPGQLIDWVIAGGESGPGARAADVTWFREIQTDCSLEGVPFFMKQLGSVLAKRFGLADRKGEDPTEWPEALATLGERAFPKAYANG